MRYSVIVTEDGNIFHDSVEADTQEEAESKARDLIAEAWDLQDGLDEARAEGDETGFDAGFDGFAVDLDIEQPAPDVDELRAAARALIDEFGGNVPDWLRPAVGRLESALTTSQPSDEPIDNVGLNDALAPEWPVPGGNA